MSKHVISDLNTIDASNNNGTTNNNNNWGPIVRKKKPNEFDEILFKSCKTGDYLKAKKALENGANATRIISLAMGQTTPLLIASQNGHVSIAELILQDKNVDINEKVGWDGQTCLHHATNNKHPEMCKFLIKNNADIEIKDRLKRTPLFDACEMGDKNLLQIFLDNNANVDTEACGYTPLQLCLDLASSRDEEGRTFLEICTILMKNNADINRRGKETGRTLLMIACAIGKQKLVNELILQRNASLHITDIDGKTALQYAIDYKKTEITNFLRKAIEIEKKKGRCIIL